MPRQSPPSPPSQPGVLDPEIWRVCAGHTVEIPTLHSMVYYFPQGHFEQASSAPRNLSPLLLSKPAVLCRVESVQLLADPLTDEVFAKQILHPVADCFAAGPSAVAPAAAASAQNDKNKVVSFPKVLTASDANSSEGFSFPMLCAVNIFPPLNYRARPPEQNLLVTDVHGFVWVFRHIHGRKHLLTTGWSTFVNNKKLVAGDTVVFMKNSRGGLFVGIRRATCFSMGMGGGRGGMRIRMDEEEEEEEVREVFSRDGKGKLPAKVVAEAAELAARNMPFEVVYYPKAGWSEFVVKTEAVNEAMKVAWSPGMRVKIPEETDDSSRAWWCLGMVSSVALPGNGQWRGSLWRMLQVKREEPEGAKWVNPWQVKLTKLPPVLLSAFTPTQRTKNAHDSGVFTNGGGDPFPMTGFTNSTMGPLNQALLSYGTFPTGMQGARHDVFSASRFCNYPIDMSHLSMGNTFGNSTFPWPKTLETEIKSGSPQYDELSPNSRGSLQSCGTDLGNSRKLVSVSFQLFGAVILRFFCLN